MTKLLTLLEMKTEMGRVTFDRCMHLATSRMNASHYRWMCSDARRAYIYEEMQHLYEKWNTRQTGERVGFDTSRVKVPSHVRTRAELGLSAETFQYNEVGK